MTGSDEGDGTGEWSGSVRVLYVDSDEATAERVQSILETDRDALTVETAATVAAATDRLTGSALDCLVTELDLPDGDGIEMLQTARAERPDLPVVVYTAHGSEERAGEALAAGAAAYRPKGTIEETAPTLAADVLGAVQAKAEATASLDRMTDGFFAVDETWQFTAVNERGRRILGEAIGEERTADQLRGTSLWAAIPDANDSTFGEQYTEAMESQEPVSFVEHYEPLETWFEVRAYPTAGGLAVYFTDITEKKVSERELERREKVLTQMHRIVSEKDSSFEEKVDELLGIGRAELEMEYGSLSHIDGEDYVFDVVKCSPDNDTIAAGDVLPLSWTSCERTAVTEETLVIADMETDAPDLAQRQGNVELGLECYLGAPVLIDGEVDGTFCFYDEQSREEPFSKWEVTLVELMGNWVSYERERKHREQALARERNRLEEFASMVSHDLRNPLNVATARTELAAMECDSDHVQEIEDALDRMDTLIEDVLALARLGQEVVDQEAVDFTEVVQMAWGTAGDDPGELVLEADGETIVGDPSRLQRLFENLFRNAVEHGVADEDDVGASTYSLTVRVGPLEDAHGFYVADDGRGFRSGAEEELFDHGYTTDEAGTGFGLSIVEEIVEAHGGEITATESESGGARFEVTGIEVR